MLTGPGRRAAADLGQLRPRKDLQNREKASITLRALGTRSAFVGRRPRGSRIMCRWIFYYGEEVCISKLIYGASHGLATMADSAGWTPGCARDAERNHEVNVHGCGA